MWIIEHVACLLTIHWMKTFRNMQTAPSISIKNCRLRKSTFRVTSSKFKTTSLRLLNVAKVSTSSEKTLTKMITRLNVKFQSLHLTCIHSNGIKAMTIILISVILYLEIGLMKDSRKMPFQKVRTLRLKESSKTSL